MIRLGVIGYGERISGVIGTHLRGVAPDLRVVGIVDPDEPGARRRLAEVDRRDAVFYTDLPEMMRKARLDALAIGTRCHLHTPYAVAAAQYGIPLYLEKPVATSLDQAHALESAFEKSECEVVVSFPLRVSPLCSLAKQYLDEGAVGEPVHVLATNYVSYGSGYFEDKYREFEITQGLFVQKGTHDFDYLQYLMGSNIVRIAAMGTYGRVFGGNKPAGLVCSQCDEAHTCQESPANRRRNGSGGKVRDHHCVFGEDIRTEHGMNEDASSALLDFGSGAHGVYTQVFFSRRDAERRGATISGYRGTVSFDWYDNNLKRVRHHSPFSDVSHAASDLSHFGGDAELAADFIDVVRGTGRSRTPVWTGIQSIYACLAAKESAETGQYVDVRQVGQVTRPDRSSSRVVTA